MTCTGRSESREGILCVLSVLLLCVCTMHILCVYCINIMCILCIYCVNIMIVCVLCVHCAYIMCILCKYYDGVYCVCTVCVCCEPIEKLHLLISRPLVYRQVIQLVNWLAGFGSMHRSSPVLNTRPNGL